MLLTQLSLEQKSFQLPEWRGTARRWHWAVTRSTPVLLWPEMRGRQVKPACGRNHDVGAGCRTHSMIIQTFIRRTLSASELNLRRWMNLGHEPELRWKVFRAETMKTAIRQDAEFEIHAFWHRQPVKLLPAAAVSRGRVVERRRSVALSSALVVTVIQ